MPEKEELPELAAWLARVKSKYEQMKRRTNLDGGGVVVDREVEGSDTYGLDFIEMNGSKNPKDNWDLVPDRANEEFVDRVFFQPRYALMASSAPGGHLLAPTMFLNLKCSRLRVFFNPTTQRPVRIDGYAEGGGKANPTGQFANWLDLYGSRLIVRLLGVGDYEMRDGGGKGIMSRIHLKIVSFTNESAAWSARAQFSVPSVDSSAEGHVAVEKPGSLIAEHADFNVLGRVPSDYPGVRRPEYGEPYGPQ
ncbi:MAG: hypothetical protein GDA68_22555 [Nitrospira sp. CR2.1]|nr:hypothetical protein [Nitrospira sp. CR2.1]